MIAVRALCAGDEAAWRTLWCAYLAFYETQLDDRIFNLSFARLIDPDIEDYQGLVADLNGVTVGLAHSIYHRHGWQAADVCYLQDLYVAPQHRGTGIGRALIEAVFDAADAAGKPAVYWLTQGHNTAARALYDRIGSVTPFIKYKR